MSRMMKKIFAIVMSFVVAFGLMSVTTGTAQVEAAKKVSISSTKKTLEQKQSCTLELKNAKGKIKWSVSNSEVATIQASGKKCKVTAVTGGSATVTAKLGKKSYKCKVTVKGLDVKSASVSVGKSTKIKAVNLGSKVSWSVSNKKVATISAKKAECTVKGVGVGTVTVTAKVGKKSYQCKVAVQGLDTKSATINKGKTVKIKAVNLGSKISWSVSDKKVATISAKKAECTVKGVKAGTVTVTAKVGKAKYTCKVIVSAPVQSVKSVSVVEGKTTTVKLTGITSGTKVTWSVAGSDVKANVFGASCTLTAVKAGKATVKAVVNGQTYTWTITVTAKPVQKPSDDTDNSGDQGDSGDQGNSGDNTGGTGDSGNAGNDNMENGSADTTPGYGEFY